MKNNDDKYLLQSVSNALDILDLLHISDTMNLAEICNATGLGKSTAFRTLYTLESKGFVAKDEDARYRLDIKFARYGTKLLESQDILTTALPYLESLRDSLNESSHLGVRNANNHCVIIHKVLSRQAIPMSSAIGVEMEFYCTASGKIITAFLDEALIDERIAHCVPHRYTENTFTDKKAIKEELLLTRQRGYSADMQEREMGLVCFAFPIFDYTRRIVGSISISGISVLMLEKKERIIREVRQATQQISAELGYVPIS